MKKSYLLYAFAIILGMAFFNTLVSNNGGAPSGRTGSPIDVGTCNASGCHNSFALNSGDATLSLFHNIPATGYVPGSTYTININLTEQGKGKFGFESSAYSPDANANVGAVNILNSTETKINPGVGNYVTHTSMGTSGTDTKDWSYDWTAPNPGAGEVIFFASGNVADGGGSPANDHIYNVSDTVIQGAGVSIDPIQDLFQAKVFPTLVEEFLFVEMENLTRGKLDLRITNMNGQQVFDLNQEIRNETFATRIPVQNWATGVYFMTISHNGKMGFEKIVKK